MEKIGEGTFGNVYKAGIIDEKGKEKLIAIKKLKFHEKVTTGLHITTLRELCHL